MGWAGPLPPPPSNVPPPSVNAPPPPPPPDQVCRVLKIMFLLNYL